MNCPYCGTEVRLVDSIVVYRKASYGNIWLCSNYPECDSYVGADKNNRPKGRLANKELRQWKRACHTLLDSFWLGGLLKREESYWYLQRVMNKPAAEAHIAMLDLDECV